MSDTIGQITPIGPRRVLLRNRSHAVITYRVPGPPPWEIMGKLGSEGEGDPVLFMANGRFAENLDKSPNDIVGVQNEDGLFTPYTGIKSLQ